ncbi:MAG: hypothetical protein WAO98_05230 [Alphaproteobacteria bacterium]
MQEKPDQLRTDFILTRTEVTSGLFNEEPEVTDSLAFLSELSGVHSETFLRQVPDLHSRPDDWSPVVRGKHTPS